MTKTQEIQVKPTDKLDRIKKERFVQYYRESRGHISNCAKAVHISRQTYYTWLESDEWFLKQIQEAEMELNDDMRDALITQGGDGNLGAIIFYLKKRHPDFKDTPQTLLQVNNYSQVTDEQKDRYGI